MPYPLRRAWKAIGEHPLLALATTSTLAILVVLLGTFLLIVRNLSGLQDAWGDEVQVSLYLRENLEEDHIFALKAEIDAMDEVESVHYVSPEEALDRFTDAEPGLEQIFADLDTNPLPASLEIRLLPESQEPSRVESFARRLQRPEVADIDWSRTWVERYHAFVSMLRGSALLLGALLLAAAVVLVANTMGLAVHARRDELALVALIGGTRGFAQAPFLAEGLLEGLAGGGLAIVGLLAVHREAERGLRESLGLFSEGTQLAFLPVPVLLGLVLASGLSGLVGAWFSVRRIEEIH